MENIYNKEYYEPNLKIYLKPIPPRKETLEALALHNFTDNAGQSIVWTAGQLEIIDCILWRGSQEGLKRIEIIASTQYGKSLAVAAGVVIRASSFPEKWAIVAGTTEKARIIMEHIVMLALNTITIRQELISETPLDRLRMKKNADRLGFRLKGEVRVYSAEAGRVSETSKSLMGFGAQNVIEDESALVGDVLQATVMRMLGGYKDNFLVKIGNPFNRGHFYRTWKNGKYHRVFIDYQRALDEGRYTKEFIDEMAAEALFEVLYGCKFPEEGSIDQRGWLPLITESELERCIVDIDYILGDPRLGADIAGGGRNFSTMVLRGYNVAKKIYKENESDTMSFVGTIRKKVKENYVRAIDLFVDMVGIGRGVYDRLSELSEGVNGVSGGAIAESSKLFVNVRAEMYWRLRQWLLGGGKLFRDDDWSQLLEVKYKVDSSGRVKIMSKEEMLKEGIDSPDVADALAMTFARSDLPPVLRQQQDQAGQDEEVNDDPYE
jgi:hypothetical protein